MDWMKKTKWHEIKTKLAIYLLLAGVVLLIVRFLGGDSDLVLTLGLVFSLIGFLFLEFWYG